MSVIPYPTYPSLKPAAAFSPFPTLALQLNTAILNSPFSTVPLKATGTSTTIRLDQPSAKRQKSISSALTAVALIGLGLMLNRIPAKASAFEMVSTRLEDWVKMGLGVSAVGKLNEALNWQPQPWQHGLETVSVLTFLTQGLRLKGWKHFPLLALSVPALVQGTHWLSHTVESSLDSHHSNLPRWIPKLAITLASTIGGVYGLRGIMQAAWYRNAMGNVGSTSGQQTLGAETLVCSRCGGAHLVCMEEVSDFIGSMIGWFTKHLPIGNKNA